MTPCTNDELDRLMHQLLACPVDQRPAWLEEHRSFLCREMIDWLKDYSDERLKTDLVEAADDATRCALLLADYLPDDPCAHPLALWGRGNYLAYHHPQEAVPCYQEALAGYQRVDDRLRIARLFGNLVFCYTECGRYDEAAQAYQEAQPVYQSLKQQGSVSQDDITRYQLRLEQNYGFLLDVRGQHEAALQVYDQALQLAYAINRLDFVAEIEDNRGVAFDELGQIEESKAALLRSRELAVAHHQSLTVARIDMNLAKLYGFQQQPAEALRRNHAARQQLAALGNQLETGWVLLAEAMLLEQIGALREACLCYKQAEAHFATFQVPGDRFTALTRGAAAYRKYGEYNRVSHLLDEADALWQDLNQPLWSTAVLFERVELALRQEDTAEALELLSTPLPTPHNPALAIRRDLLCAEARTLEWLLHRQPEHRDAARHAFRLVLEYAQHEHIYSMQRQALAGLGRLALADDPAGARQHLEAAVELDMMIRSMLSIDELKASFQALTSDILPMLARLAFEEQQPWQVLHYIWQAKGSAFLEVVQATRQQLVAEEQEHLNEVRRQLASCRLRLSHKESESGQGVGTGSQDAELAPLREQITHLEGQLMKLRRRYNQEQVAHIPAALRDPSGLVQQMDADVLIEYFTCDDDLFAVRADRSGTCTVFRLTTIDRVWDLSEQLELDFNTVYTQPLERRIQNHDIWLRQSLPILQQGYDLLIRPLGAIPAESRLLIAPCDTLYLLPFAAFWDGQHYLMERYTLAMILSGAVLAVTPTEEVSTHSPLVIADSAGGHLQAVHREVETITLLFPDSQVIVDNPARPDDPAADAVSYLDMMQTAPRLLHIAAHSLLRDKDEAPVLSALQIPGGLLSVEQCYDLPLVGTELVTLSGCTTASGLDTGGSLLALQSAFLAAGARHVVSSLWEVNDEVAVPWMHQFYLGITSGLSPAQALRQAQRALLTQPGLHHPACWAAFVDMRR